MKTPLSNISVYMLFHHEWNAVRKSLESVLKHYPNCQILLGRDVLAPENNKELTDIDYEFITTRSCMEKFVRLNKNGEGLESFSIVECYEILKCHVDRALDVALKAKYDDILFLEPDGYMRFKHSPKVNLDMETLTENPYSQQVIRFVNENSSYALKIDGWGFVVGFVRKEALHKMHDWFGKNQKVIMELMNIDRRFAYMDFSFPLLAHMSGSIVEKSQKIIECNRRRSWRFSRKPLLHQYKEFHKV